MSIGAKYFKDENRQKVSGADMLPAVLLSLSYGKCPVDPSVYLLEDHPTWMAIHWNHFGILIDRIAEVMDKEFRPLTFGSAKQYLSAMRKGFRANRNGDLPPLNVTLSAEEMRLYIPKRDYKEDRITYEKAFTAPGLSWMFSA